VALCGLAALLLVGFTASRVGGPAGTGLAAMLALDALAHTASPRIEAAVVRALAEPALAEHAAWSLAMEQVALITLLNEMEGYKAKEIIIIVNDSAINEIIKGTTATKNQDVMKMAINLRKKLSRFENIVIKDVSKDHAELLKWNEILKF
jgi:hypothetical protein